MRAWRLREALAIVGGFIILGLITTISAPQSVAAVGPTPTPTRTPQPRAIRTATPRPNAAKTTAPQPTRTGTATPTPTATSTPTPTASPTPQLNAASEPWFAVATYYSWDFAGLPTASGETYDPTAISSACHWSLLNDWLQVTNVDNGYSVLTRCNDTGPFYWNGDDWEPMPWWRIDMSEAAFSQIASLDQGVIVVEVFKIAGEVDEE